MGGGGRVEWDGTGLESTVDNLPGAKPVSQSATLSEGQVCVFDDGDSVES